MPLPRVQASPSHSLSLSSAKQLPARPTCSAHREWRVSDVSSERTLACSLARAAPTDTFKHQLLHLAWPQPKRVEGCRRPSDTHAPAHPRTRPALPGLRSAKQNLRINEAFHTTLQEVEKDSGLLDVEEEPKCALL